MADRQIWGTLSRLRRGDTVLFRIPRLDHSITVNEVHASQLGAAVGLLSWWLYASGLTYTAAAVLLTTAGYAIVGAPLGRNCPHDAPDYGPIGLVTIRHEPWYFFSLLVGVLLLLLITT